MSRMRVRAVIEHQGKFLLARLKVAEYFWCLPGGGIEPGEDVLGALERELIEETGIKPQIGNLLFIHQIQRLEGYDVPEFFFHVTNGQDYLEIDLASTSHGNLEIEEMKFMDLIGIKLLPDFLMSELPKLVQNNFKASTQIKISKSEE